MRMRTCAALLTVLVIGCTKSNLQSDGSGGSGGSGTGGLGGGASPIDMAGPPSDLAHLSSPATFRLFDHIPQFGIYTNADPANYAPPPGVLMWSHGTVFVTKLTADQQAEIGADLAARVTYHAQCDNYDRIGGLFFIIKPSGQAPQPTDARTELVRFITPFSDYTQGTYATHVYPDTSLAPFAGVLADGGHDVWIGISGGSNPYDGDPCTRAGVSSDFAAVGFLYSVDFVSSLVLPGGSTLALTAFNDMNATVLPMTGTFNNSGGDISGHVTVIVSGHGSASGGDEYLSTTDTVTLNGTNIGQFNTQIDCSPYLMFSPDGNRGIFQKGNARNWCPGALVAAHSFPATLHAGSNSVSLGVSPSGVPQGSYYAASITFSAP